MPTPANVNCNVELSHFVQKVILCAMQNTPLDQDCGAGVQSKNQKSRSSV